MTDSFFEEQNGKVEPRQDWQPSRYRLNGEKLGPIRHGVAPGSWFYVLAMLDAVANFRPYLKGVIADLGCGYAPFYEWYSSHVEKAILVDWPNTAHKNPLIDKEADLSEQLPLDTSSVDTILLSSVIEHLPKPELIFSECLRILRPGGHVLIEVPFTYWLHEVPHDYFRFTEHCLRRLTEESGGEIVLLHPFGTIFGTICDPSSKLAVFFLRGATKGLNWRIRKPIRRYGEASIIQLQRFFYWLGTRKFLNGPSGKSIERSMPLGYVLIVRKRFDEQPDGASSPLQ